ncbi:MAG: hypothetical protein H8D65_02250, partial [Spirochaetes bacterium]|nr:hypothetical protein [Spirochaetota bacterium]
MKKIKIGLACLYFPNFQAKEYDIFTRSLSAMKGLSECFGFDLAAGNKMISSEEEANAAADYFAAEKVDFLLLQASSLILGDIILPFAAAAERIGFWVVPEPVLAGELPLNSLTGFNLGVSVLRQNFPDRLVKWFYGSPECNDYGFQDRLAVTIQALRCLKNLQGSRVGLIHDAVPTFINLTFDRAGLKKSLGVEVVIIGLDEIFKGTSGKAGEVGGGAEAEAKAKAEAEAEAVAVEMYETAAEVRVPKEEVVQSGRVTSLLLSIAEKHCLAAVALRCWPEFQDVMQLAPCASVAYLNDHGLITSCEGDLPGAVSMLAAWYISNEAPTMNDPVAMDFEKDLIQMWHCGPGPASWADETGQTLDWHHTLNRRISEGEKKAGLSSDIAFKKGAVTLLHTAGDGSTIFVMQGEVVEGPAKPYPGSGGWIGNLTCNGFSCSAADFLQSITTYGFEHHYPIMRGHHEAAVREAA